MDSHLSDPVSLEASISDQEETVQDHQVPLTTAGDTYPSPEALQYLTRQEHLFDQCLQQLLMHYPLEFVAFEEGEVLDHDPDEIALAQRVYGALGYRPILIRQVVEQEPLLRVGGSLSRS